MAAGTLIIAIIMFSARGFFLGLPGVIARLLGMLCAYIIAFSYRGELAQLLAARSDSGLPPLLFQVISSAILFFGTLVLVSLTVIGLFKLLVKLFPSLGGLLSKEATGGRIAGALFNGAIGAGLVLAGIWLYGLTLGKDQHPDSLQQVANRFGDTLVDIAGLWLKDQPGHRDSHSVVTSVVTSKKGTAEIISEESPEKRVLVERIQEVVESATSSGDTSELQALLQSPQVKKLANDPALQQKLMKLLQDNPQQTMEALNNPKIRELLEQMNSQ